MIHLQQRQGLHPWDPFGLARAMLDHTPIEESDGAPVGRWSGRAPRFDIVEHDEEYVIMGDLPGVAESDIDVTAVGNDLTISGSRSLTRESDEYNFHVRERAYGQFMRRFTMPAQASLDETTASLDGGVLTLTIPKKPEARPRKISLTERLRNKLRS